MDGGDRILVIGFISLTGLDPFPMQVFILQPNGHLEVCDDTHFNFELSQGVQEYWRHFMTKSHHLVYEACAWTLGTSELRSSSRTKELLKSPGSLTTKKPQKQSKLLFRVYIFIDMIYICRIPI